MQLIANRLNDTYLRSVIPSSSQAIQIDYVLAAIAYGNSASDQTLDLIGNTIKNKLRLDLWMRYDETVPVSIELLKRLLKHLPDNIFTKFIPDCFHPKVIWWKGYGAYIGSANHTDNGWLSNIEAGVFITDDELQSNGIDTTLDEFFDYLKDLDKAIPISANYIKEMERFQELNKGAHEKARKARSHEEWGGPVFIDQKKAFDKRKDKFKQEWLSTLGYLDSIAAQLNKYQPIWIASNVPVAWQVDQFLHAYYYNRVGENLEKPYEEYYEKHRSNPNNELTLQLEWWASLKSAPSNEDLMLHQNAPTLKSLLEKSKIKSLTVTEFEDVCGNTHATMDHIIKVPLKELGVYNVTSLDRQGRLKLFTSMMLGQRNKKGWDIRELLHYVMYDGQDGNIWERIYNAGRDTEYRIARYGLNSIAELVGWARPEIAPPRNGRTSKALRALGFDVKIY